MTVLVVGAGLIGSRVARRLVDRGDRPVVMDRAVQTAALRDVVDIDQITLVTGDILDHKALSTTLREHRISAIVHLAANPMLTVGAQRDPYEAIRLNILGSTSVFEAARKAGVRRVVVASSNVLNHYMAGGTSGGLANAAIAEDALPRPTSFYAATKQAVENLGLNYARWTGLEFAALRYGAVMGPWRGEGGGGPSNAFRDAVANALKGEESVIPSSAMEWIYSKDAAEATVAALFTKDLKGAVFNVTMGRIVSPAELAAALRDEFPGGKVRVAEQPKGMPTMNAVLPSDISLAQSVLGFTPRYGIREAIRELAAWMRSLNAAKSGALQ